MTLTEKLRQIISQANEATEGPWGIDSGMNYTQTKSGTQFQHIIGARGAAICNTSHFDEVRANGELWSEQRHGKMEDARFIASSRVLVPALARALGRSVEALSFIKDGCLVPPDGGSPKHPEDSMAAAKEALAEIAKILLPEEKV